MDITKNKNTISFKLNQNEALVLFEWVSNYNKEGNKNTINNTAEEQLLWNIEACLERVLTAPFKPNYDKLLEEARQNVCNNT